MEGSLLLSLVVTAACKREIVPEPYAPTGAHDAYRHALEQAGLHRTALGRDWAKAAEDALRSPVPVEAPFEETFHVDSAEAFALGYRFSVKRARIVDHCRYTCGAECLAQSIAPAGP